MTNLVILVGRIARDPETRTTTGGTTITSISVVTDRPARKDGKTYKDENGYTAKDSEFHRVTCFNGLGQNVAKYCSKGQMVTVEGRIHYTQWEDTDIIPAPPAPRLIRLPEVMARVGMKRSAIYQRMSEGRFPKSRSLGPKCAVWVEKEIEEWIDQVVRFGNHP